MPDAHAVAAEPNPTPEIPPLPPDASPEQHEEHWYAHVYQGDRVPQLTLRAVLMGGILGMFMAIANLYTTVKIGWSFGVAITACVLSYVLWNGARGLSLGRLTPMSILENNCMQSTASAAGYSTGGTIGVAFGAMLLLNGSHVPWQVLLPVTLFTAALGVFAAIPMKRQMINVERLPFPSGIAAAQTLRSLYSRGRTALHQAYALLASLLFGALLGLLRTAEGTLWYVDKLLGSVRIPEALSFPALTFGSRTLRLQGFAFDPSVLLIGAGMLVGLRVSLSLLLGSAILYFVVTPLLVEHDASLAHVAGRTPSLVVGPDGAVRPTSWALWGGTSVMLFASLTSLALAWPMLVRSFRLSAARNAGRASVEVPFSWFVAGMIPISIGMVFLEWWAFKMSVTLGLISVAMTFVVALVCCRATGETDTTPMTATGQLTQLAYSLLAHGERSVNLMSAGVTAGAGSSAADLLTDLKSGYVLGANARKQFLAQFYGLFFGTLAVVPAWYLMFPTKAALEAANPPTTLVWKAVAEALTKGLGSVPVTAQYSILFGALVGIALPVLARGFPRLAPWMPSAIGLGFSWVMSFSNTLSFAIGALLTWAWTRLHRRSAETFNVPVASGLVAGESLMSAIVAILISLPTALPELWNALRGAGSKTNVPAQ
ncbi:OPT oligopeptide transporter protein [Phycisphaerae bacterium RAS1]|nr:OPT oligopeptide transporter protein [Phycisphaerae bacterium RAS1]